MKAELCYALVRWILLTSFHPKKGKPYWLQSKTNARAGRHYTIHRNYMKGLDFGCMRTSLIFSGERGGAERKYK